MPKTNIINYIPFFYAAFAQSSVAPTVSGISTTVLIVICISCCIVYFRYLWKSDTTSLYSRVVTHANTNPSLTPWRSHTSRVIHDQSHREGVVIPSTNAVPYASISGIARPLVPTYVPAAPHYELSEYNAEAPPPYSRFPPPCGVHNAAESGAEVQAQLLLHTASYNGEFHNAVDSVAEVKAAPTIYAAPFSETPCAENQEPTSTPRPETETQIQNTPFQDHSDARGGRSECLASAASQ